LTKGEPVLVDVVGDGDRTADEVLGLAAAVDADSEHPLARAIVAGAGTRDVKVPRADGFEALPGVGGRAMVAGREVSVGGPRLLEQLKLRPKGNLEKSTEAWAAQGRTVLYVVADGQMVGALALEDEIRPESRAAIDRLQVELAGMGIDAPCLGSIAATPDVVSTLDCTAAFTSPVYGRDYHNPREFQVGVDRTSRELTRALRRLGTWPDILILPCCDQVLAASVARVLRRHPLKPPPQVLMWLLYGPHHQLAPDNPAAIALHDESRRAFTALLNALGDRWHLAYNWYWRHISI